jgi:uncharacterized protein
VKLLDVNLLVYAANRDDPRHEKAADWFDTLMNSGEQVALPSHTLLGFLRVATNPRVFQRPLPVSDALEFIEDWLEWDSVWVPEPTADHYLIMARLLRSVPRSQLVPDAHLAALAIGHGLTLCSNDVDFRLFKDLRLENPLD